MDLGQKKLSKVHRRTGGLENTTSPKPEEILVHRRTGGLEKQQALVGKTLNFAFSGLIKCGDCGCAVVEDRETNRRFETIL